MRFSPFKTKKHTTSIFILKFLSMYNVLQVITDMVKIYSKLTMFIKKMRCFIPSSKRF
ncbi:hypothetical protein EMIT040CA3_320105 [Bacillus pseudomycoides]